MPPRSYVYAAAVLAVSCFGSSGGRTVEALEAGESPSAPVFGEADSLMLTGRFDESLEALAGILGTMPGERDAALYRLVGLFHSCGREAEGVLFLDSLEAAWGSPLGGWQASLLDLAGDSIGASARTADPYLRTYLGGFIQPPGGLATPSTPAEVLVRLRLAPPGSLTADQMKACADLAGTFPDAAERLAEEMRKRLSIPQEVWDRDMEVLRASGRAEDADLLAVARMGATHCLDEAVAAAVLGSQPGPAGEAALLLISRGSPGWRTSWRVADALAQSGHTSELAGLLSSSTDQCFSAGARMALLRAASRPSDLLGLCDSVGAAAPDSLRARASLFRARALRDLDRDTEAWSAYLDFAGSWPDHPASHESAFLAGRYYDAEQDWPRAAEAFETALASPGEGRYDESCYWRGGFARFAQGDSDAALSLWTAGCSEFESGFWRDEMLYWSARATPAGSAGRTALLREAASGHPWEYYGLLASDILGDEPDWHPSYPSLDPPAEALALVRAGYGRLASEVLRYSAIPDTVSRIAGLSILGEHRRAIELCGALDSRLRYSGSGMLPDSVAILQFPAPYSDLVREVAGDLSTSPELITAIMREESSFDRLATSSVGARGLIQLMPGTAHDVARWYGLPELAGVQLYEPRNSIRYGSIYIDRQWGAFSGELPLILAAYNAGPGNASRWRESLPYTSDHEWFTERITYRETREYVKRVTRSCWIYGRLME